jgi:hypothetical protein
MSEENLFGDLDFEKASDNPFEIPDNAYVCYLTDVKVGPTKAGDKVGMTLKFTIDEGAHKGKTISEWKHIPQPSDPKNPSDDDLRALSYIKARMKDLGIPGERVNSVKPDDLIGIKAVVAVKNNNGYTNVRKVTVVADDFSEAALASGGITDPFSTDL